MANGSRRILPTFKSSAAAVISEPTMEPRNTPWFQSRDWCTSGMVLGRRPPNRNAEIGTPLGSSHSFAIAGHCFAGAVKRAFGCANSSPFGLLSVGNASRVLFFQSTSLPFAGYPICSHHISPSSVKAQLVKMVFSFIDSIAFLLDWSEVPGATPKKPASGLMA